MSEKEGKSTMRKLDDNTVITRDIKDVQNMFEGQNITSGKKSTAQQKSESKEIEPKIFKIPGEIFEDFSEIENDKEDLFEYLAYQIVINFLEKSCLKIGQDSKPQWDIALEFPDLISAPGRSKLHLIARHFGLAHHTVGKKGKSRRTLLYAKILYLEKQEADIKKLTREREKLRDKHQKTQLNPDIMPSNSVLFIENVLTELWYEKYKPAENKGAWYIPDPNHVGKEPDVDKLIELIRQKKKKLDTDYHNYQKLQERAKEDIKKMDQVSHLEAAASPAPTTQDKKEEKEGKKKVQSEVIGESSEEIDQEEIDLESMDDETRIAYLEKQVKILKVREAEQKKLNEYSEKLENETLKTFQDAPDEVKQIFVCRSFEKAVELSWDAPEDNNSKITKYNIYLSKKIIKNIGQADLILDLNSKHEYKLVGSIDYDKLMTDPYLLGNLSPGCIYYVLVTAINSNGEGYKNEVPSPIRTMQEGFHEPCQLYVWGSNSYSEIGLTEELVANNKKFYHSLTDKACLTKAVKHNGFNTMVNQVACGFMSTTVLCQQGDETVVVQMGSASILNEANQNSEQNLMEEKDLIMLQDINSLPFEIQFYIPVVKVTAGDVFAGLLTAEGQVFTWGHNQYGQLGIDKENIMVQLKPDSRNPLKFKDEGSLGQINIIDIVQGNNSMIALSDEKKIFVWGRRMGIYPQIELTLASVEQKGIQYDVHEIHQASPRLCKNNLIFHKISKVCSGYFNSALITDKGELLIQGMNDYNQLALPSELSEHLKFFPEFMKLDFFNDYLVKDVAIGEFVVNALCEHRTTGRVRLFAWGSNKYGQLGIKDTKHIQIEPLDITHHFVEEKRIDTQDVLFDEDEIVQVSCGGSHTLILTQSQQLIGLGQLDMGQLATETKGCSYSSIPLPIKVKVGKNEKIQSIQSGNNFSVALVK